jgi:hypothetical protein
MTISIKYNTVALALLLSSAAAFSPIKPSRTSLQLSAEKKDASTSIMEDATEALASVGWAPPSSDAELTSDDPFVRQIDASIQKDIGVGLDELLNPAKVRFSQVNIRSSPVYICLLHYHY